MDKKQLDINKEMPQNLHEDEYDAPPMDSMYHPYLGMLGMKDGPAAEEGTEAIAGLALAPDAKIASVAQVIDALKTVFDPEIPVNIYDLGLIYKHEVDQKGDCDILMTLTAPACPVAGEMPMQVANVVAAVEGIGIAKVTLTWSPPWDRDLMSEDAKMALDIW